MRKEKKTRMNSNSKNDLDSFQQTVALIGCYRKPAASADAIGRTLTRYVGTERIMLVSDSFCLIWVEYARFKRIMLNLDNVVRPERNMLNQNANLWTQNFYIWPKRKMLTPSTNYVGPKRNM